MLTFSDQKLLQLSRLSSSAGKKSFPQPPSMRAPMHDAATAEASWLGAVPGQPVTVTAQASQNRSAISKFRTAGMAVNVPGKLGSKERLAEGNRVGSKESQP